MRAGMSVRMSPPLADVLPLRSGLRDVLPQVARDVSRGVRDRTAGGRDVDGRPFARKADGSPSTLKDTGRMVESFKPQTVTDQSFRLAPDRGERRKAVMHQRGIGRIPRREWVGVDARQVDEAVERVLDAEIPIEE